MLIENLKSILYLLFNLIYSFSFNEVKDAYEAKHNKLLKPIFRHENKLYPPKGAICHYYGHKLTMIKLRNYFDIYKCINPKYSHYKPKLKNLSKDNKQNINKIPLPFLYITSHVSLRLP